MAIDVFNISSNNKWYNNQCTLKTVGPKSVELGSVHYYGKFLSLLCRCFCIGLVKVQDAGSQKVYQVNRKEFNRLKQGIQKQGVPATPIPVPVKTIVNPSATTPVDPLPIPFVPIQPVQLSSSAEWTPLQEPWLEQFKQSLLNPNPGKRKTVSEIRDQIDQNADLILEVYGQLR